jgi:Tfp pilus assembly PilM family ATPase
MSGPFSERRAEVRTGWLAGDAPWAAVEIASDRVSVVGLTKDAGGPAVQGWAAEELPPGVVTPSLTSLNVSDGAAVTDALRRAAGRAGLKARRVGLVIPDLAAKVSLVPFDTVPDRAEDLSELINWQVRKAAPFRIEDAQVAHVPGAPHGDKGRTFVVTMARRDVVRQYEDVCAAAGMHAGIVDLASFNVINAVLAGRSRPEGDWLLVNTTRESQTLAIMRGGSLMFFRNRSLDGDETLPDLVHQTAMYYEDRLQGAGFERVVLAGDAGQGDDTRKSLADRLRAPVTSIEPRQVAALSSRGLDDLQPGAAEALVAPLGLLLRERTGSAGL